jgi:NIPSNAP
MIILYVAPMQFNRRTLLAGTTALLFAPLAVRGNDRKGFPLIDDQVFELRQYTLRGGQRDTLISLFEENFIEPQDALGAHVVGTFRDLDDPDRFVWIRGFRDMAKRQAALTAFYGGPVWKAHRTIANATMIDSDNVLLLKQVGTRLAATKLAGAAVYGARIFALGDVDAVAFEAAFAEAIAPRLARLGTTPIATFVSDATPNNFPALPVRSDRVFVILARWPSVDAERRFDESWHKLTGWRDAVPERVLPALMRKPERLRLLPTQRSALR